MTLDIVRYTFVDFTPFISLMTQSTEGYTTTQISPTT